VPFYENLWKAMVFKKTTMVCDGFLWQLTQSGRGCGDGVALEILRPRSVTGLWQQEKAVMWSDGGSVSR
jgi:hypothetical protein